MRFLKAFLKVFPGLLVLVSVPALSDAVSPDWQCQNSPRGWVCAAANPKNNRSVQPTPATPTIADIVLAVPPTIARPVAPEPESHRQLPSRVKPNTRWRYCATKPELPTDPGTIINLDPSERTNTPMNIDADSVEYLDSGAVTYRGGVLVERADQRLHADHLTYHPGTDVIIAEGHTRYQESGLVFEAPRAEIQLSDNTGTLQNPTYFLPKRNGRGTADRVDIKSATVTEYQNATYTTCELDDPEWQIKTEHLTVDKAEGAAVGRNIRLQLGSTPVLYSPWLRFPIDDRRLSGFLLPSVGSSDKHGFNVATPWYWNIAPNQDATITPLIMAKRGILLGSEHRYLGKHINGIATVEVIPDDKVAHRSRGFLDVKHTGNYNSPWHSEIKAQYVSDTDYLDDFGTSLATASTGRLERRIDLRYRKRHWSLLGRAQYFQTLTEGLVDTSKPYQRMPQLLFNGTLPTNTMGLKATLRAEAVQFERNNTVTGNRLDLLPRIERRFQTAAAYITPAVSAYHTEYWLDDPTDPTVDRQSRTVPAFSLDSGVFFERDTRWAGQAMQQTLEPRLFYLYVDPVDQSDIPVFDSGLPGFNFAQLFQENRFSGADRIGDANQITAALTSRFINQTTGEEQLRATLGQIFYLRDRTVTLPGSTADTTNSSDMVADIYTRFGQHWQLRSGLQWDPHNEQSKVGLAQMRYHSGQDHIANLAYRRRRGSLEHVDASLRWALRTQTHAVARWNYSLRENRTLQGLIGLEYESCCWLARIVYEEHILETGPGEPEDTNASVRLQFELKGLSSFGSDIKSNLGQQILGYRPDDDPDTE